MMLPLVVCLHLRPWNQVLHVRHFHTGWLGVGGLLLLQAVVLVDLLLRGKGGVRDGR